METVRVLLCFFLASVTMAAAPVQSAADRLYTWTDDQGVSHISRTPPPAGATDKDVVDYSHRTHEEQQAAAARQAEQSDLRREAQQALSPQSGDVDSYREKIRKDLQEKAAEGQYTCYFQAPGRRVYLIVYSTNRYNERLNLIFSGWIEANQQALVISPTKQILSSHRWESKGPFGGDSLRMCSGGGIVQIPSS